MVNEFVSLLMLLSGYFVGVHREMTLETAVSADPVGAHEYLEENSYAQPTNDDDGGVPEIPETKYGNGTLRDGEGLAGLGGAAGEARERVRAGIERLAGEYGVPVQAALRIANCESGLDPNAKNASSSAKGVFQFTDGTWAYVGAVGHQFDAEENIRQFMVWWPKHPEWWVCK